MIWNRAKARERNKEEAERIKREYVSNKIDELREALVEMYGNFTELKPLSKALPSEWSSGPLTGLNLNIRKAWAEAGSILSYIEGKTTGDARQDAYIYERLPAIQSSLQDGWECYERLIQTNQEDSHLQEAVKLLRMYINGCRFFNGPRMTRDFTLDPSLRDEALKRLEVPLRKIDFGV